MREGSAAQKRRNNEGCAHQGAPFAAISSSVRSVMMIVGILYHRKGLSAQLRTQTRGPTADRPEPPPLLGGTLPLRHSKSTGDIMTPQLAHVYVQKRHERPAASDCEQ